MTETIATARALIAFRTETRAWLEANAPDGIRNWPEMLRDKRRESVPMDIAVLGQQSLGEYNVPVVEGLQSYVLGLNISTSTDRDDTNIHIRGEPMANILLLN